MPKTRLVGVLDKEVLPHLSELSQMIYQNSDFWFWRNPETGLYSVAVGCDCHDWICVEKTLPEVDAKLSEECPFYFVEEEVEDEAGKLAVYDG